MWYHGDSNRRPSACKTSMLPLDHRCLPVVGAADGRSKLRGGRIQDTTICHENELYFVKTLTGNGHIRKKSEKVAIWGTCVVPDRPAPCVS